MEQQDHIATLCAAGTVGIAVTGLAFGVSIPHNNNTYSTTSGKRKWPGASSLKSNTTTPTSVPSRRVVSQPVITNLTAPPVKIEHSRSASLFRRQSKHDVRPPTANNSDDTCSRGSSMNRSGMLRPRTADTRSTSERRDPSTSSSWLKRLSTVSSPRTSSPSAPSSRLEITPKSVSSPLSEGNDQTIPNKLVKRSTSQRGLSSDQARGTFLRRPATSHQRSLTVQEWTPREISFSTPATPYLSSGSVPAWKPFFERGYTRKRHITVNTKDSTVLRTISPLNLRQPTLILASNVETHDTVDDEVSNIIDTDTELKTMSTGRQRLKRSLSSVHRAARRRHFTDPTVKVTMEAVNGTITPVAKQSSFSPGSRSSAFDTDIPKSTPSFNSSPPIIPTTHRFSFRKRQSTAPSDPTTASSDNDTRVFTDDDSMDFQSDTAYDSLTTRATASSHSAFRTPKLDTVFNETQAIRADETGATLAKLMQKATLTDEIIDRYSPQLSDHFYGIGITNIEEETDKMVAAEEPARATTPVKSIASCNEDYNMTPVPNRLQYFETPLKSSPPCIASTALSQDVGTPGSDVGGRHVGEEEDEIDWSPKSNKQEKTSTSTLRQDVATTFHNDAPSPDQLYDHSYFDTVEEEESESDKRYSSIFDWSEHQKAGNEGVSGIAARPKTVHGKQGNDGSRSRSSGRKGPTQMHLRSQSVPNNRDPNTELPPLSTAKFGTWGLGHQPVSEEWSDDFDFDDADDNESPQISSGALKLGNHRTLRGVKVPQSIIDRQASVHIQFGQVQEFMLLVEELKNLRAKGAALQLLETHSKQLWEDAESIIDLATINNEDDVCVRPGSPTPSETFGDDTLAATKPGPEKSFFEEQRRNSTAFRSVSSPATPPHGRPRGESLAQAKTFLQSIHQNRSGFDSSPLDLDDYSHRKLPFDTQDLKDLVVRSGVITRALKEIVRKAEGLSVSPSKTPPRSRDPAFSQIFNAPDSSPCPPFRKPGLPKSKSANSYLIGPFTGNGGAVSTSPTPTALVL